MSKRKLLLADDSETVQKVVNLTFELEGIEVITFGDGDSAMAQFSAVAPDVVLADVNMPGMSGYDICREIKQNEETKQTPVILLVGSFEPFDEEKAMQVGADDYLTKPFQSIRQLVSKVNELLSTDGASFADEETENYSFDETLKMEESPTFESDFGDSALDDEMIQTNQIGSFPIDETAKFQTQPDFEETDISKTQPLSMKDWNDIYSSEPTAESSEQTVYELADEPAESQAPQIEQPEMSDDDEMLEPSDEKGFAFVEETYFEQPAETSEPVESGVQFEEYKSDDDLGIQPDDIDHFYREPDYEEDDENTEPEMIREDEKPEYEEQKESAEFETTVEDMEYFSDQAETNTPPENESAVSETVNEATPENDESPILDEPEEVQNSSAQPVPFLNFDEFDLLEIPFPDNPLSDSNEKISEPETSIAEEPVEEVSAATASAETEDVKSEVAEQLSGVNLSAEDIDAIADKVVEKLTARLKE